jgi:hypothetical protein
MLYRMTRFVFMSYLRVVRKTLTSRAPVPATRSYSTPVALTFRNASTLGNLHVLVGHMIRLGVRSYKGCDCVPLSAVIHPARTDTARMRACSILSRNLIGGGISGVVSLIPDATTVLKIPHSDGDECDRE